MGRVVTGLTLERRGLPRTFPNCGGEQRMMMFATDVSRYLRSNVPEWVPLREYPSLEYPSV